MSKERAKEALNYEKMSEEEKATYSRHIKNRRIESSVIETAEGRGARKEKVIAAKKGLANDFRIDRFRLGRY